MLHDDKKVIRSDFDREAADKMASVLSRVGGHHPDPVPSLSIISTERRVQQCTALLENTNIAISNFVKIDVF